eukprot:7134820-Pyramimonas_sp.AAC.1
MPPVGLVPRPIGSPAASNITKCCTARGKQKRDATRRGCTRADVPNGHALGVIGRGAWGIGLAESHCN